MQPQDNFLDLTDISDKIQLKTEEVGIGVKQVLQTGFGIFSILIGLVASVTGISLFQNLMVDWGWLVFTAFVGVMPILFGAYFIRKTAKQIQAQRKSLHEKRVMKTILRNKGSLTPQQVALQTSLPLPQVNTILDTLYAQGMLEVKMTDNGVIYYELSEALRWKQRYLN
jgi:hypothetical protein